MLAPLPLRPPQSCAHGISPCGTVLSADRQGSFFFTQALETLPCCVAVPANRCICAHASRPDAIIYPMGLAEEDQGIVECHVSYIQ